MTFLGGTVGILSLDTLELSPQWDDGIGDTGDNDHHAKDANSSASIGPGPRSGGAAKVSGARASSEEVPLLGEAQWQRLSKILEEQVRKRDGRNISHRKLYVNEDHIHTAAAGLLIDHSGFLFWAKTHAQAHAKASPSLSSWS